MRPERWADVRRLTEHALALSEEERSAWLATACDPALRHDVEALLAIDGGPDDRLREPVREAATVGRLAAAVPPGTRLGPWEVTGEIATGGMGAVYRAVRADAAFERDVAIKVIRRGLATDEVLRRFEQERRVLAGLEHPCIAQLLDAGSSSDGHPYIVMEHVDGRPIDEYCDDAGLDLRRRLRLFVRVCDAVRHAHAALVVHRDLKPGNILVTRGGEPKLLDFGIAKMLDPESGTGVTATLGASPAMTPDYASPEQVLGGPVTTATDVYSLGVVLYEIVTGRRPRRLAQSAPAEMQRLVDEPVTPPSLALRSSGHPGRAAELAGDVDTIVLKAMHADPARRYASVEQLAEDVRRHLSGRPVVARPDTWRYRAGKFVRRNRLAVAGSAVLVASLAAGFVVSWSLYRDTRALNTSLRSERARVQARFDDVHTLTRTLLADMNAALQPTPGAVRARELLVATGLDVLERLQRDAGDDDALLADVARGWLTVAEIEGGPNVANLGRAAEARRSVARARTLAEDLLRRGQGDAVTRRLLATSLVADAELAAVAGEPASVADLERALALVPPRGESPNPLRARILMALGNASLARGAFDEARDHMGQALDDLRLVAEQDGGVASTRALALGLGQLAKVEMFASRLDEAGAHARAAGTLLQPVVEAHPEHRLARQELAFAHAMEGNVALRSGRHHEAIDALQRALAVHADAVRADPGDAHARRNLMVVCTNLVQPLLLTGRLEECVSAAERAVELAEHLAAAAPRSAHTRRDLVQSWVTCARALNAAGRSRDALPLGERGLAGWRELVEGSPEDADGRRSTALAAFDLAMVQRALARAAEDDTERSARWQAARDHFQEALERMSALDSEGRLPPTDRRVLGLWAADVAGCDEALEALGTAEARP